MKVGGIMCIFPNAIMIKILNNDDMNPIPNIAIKVKLFTKHKNDYYLIPEVSNSEGIIKISREWINNEIEKIKKLFSMDYSSELNDCELKIEIRIISGDEVIQAITSLNDWKNVIKTSGNQINNLAKAENKKFRPVSKLIDFYSKDVIYIELITNTY
jgi:hypothetical protein